MAAAVTGHEAAVAAANAETNAAKAKAMRDVADRRLAVATERSAQLLQGLPANDSIRAAVRLLLGHLYAHREAVVVSTHAGCTGRCCRHRDGAAVWRRRTARSLPTGGDP